MFMYFTSSAILEQLRNKEKNNTDLQKEMENLNNTLDITNQELKQQNKSLEDEQRKNDLYEKELVKLTTLNETLLQEKRHMSEDLEVRDINIL